MNSWIRIVAVAIVATGIASLARAQNPITSLPGVNLSWDDCGAAGAANQTFACNSNTGSNTVVGSFVAPASLDDVVDQEITVDLTESGVSALESWWAFQTGGCRSNSWLYACDTSALHTCAQYWNGNAVTLSQAVPGVAGPNMIRLLGVAGIVVGTQTPMTTGTEYYAFALTFYHKSTTGPGACAGCSAQVSIVLDSIRLDEVLGTPAGDFMLIGPPPGGRDRVTWQNAPVPTADRTWGQIKALYR